MECFRYIFWYILGNKHGIARWKWLKKWNFQICVQSYCAKSVQIGSFLSSVFSCIRTENGNLPYKFWYLTWKWENTNQKDLFIWILFMQWRIALGSELPWCRPAEKDTPWVFSWDFGETTKKSILQNIWERQPECCFV